MLAALKKMQAGRLNLLAEIHTVLGLGWTESAAGGQEPAQSHYGSRSMIACFADCHMEESATCRPKIAGRNLYGTRSGPSQQCLHPSTGSLDKHGQKEKAERERSACLQRTVNPGRPAAHPI